MLGRITVALFFLLLIWGNLVAGLKAGLACPDWPLCHGTVLPPFRLDIWMEYTHRLIAALATVFLLLLSWKRFSSYQGLAKAVPLAAVALIGTEILLGGAVVLLELPVQLTTVHFMTGLTVMLLAFYMASFDGDETPARFSLQGRAGLFFGMGLVVFSQSALGAYVRHANAGQACTDFPTCRGSWFPSNMSGTLMAHFSHRLAAVLIFVTIGMLCVAAFLDPGFFRYRKMLLGLLCLCLGQIAVGALVVLSGLYYLATGLHLLVALSLLVFFFHLWSSELRQQENLS
jgi:heme A synthase